MEAYRPKSGHVKAGASICPRAHRRIRRSDPSERASRTIAATVAPLCAGPAVPTTEARDKLLAGLRHANDLMSAASPSGCFLGPGRYSLADLALSPWWFRIPVVLGTYRQFRLPDEGAEFARLRSWWGEVSERASFKRTLVSEDRLVRNYAEYADGSANRR